MLAPYHVVGATFLRFQCSAPAASCRPQVRRMLASRGGPPNSATISHLSSERLARLDRQLAGDTVEAPQAHTGYSAASSFTNTHRSPAMHLPSIMSQRSNVVSRAVFLAYHRSWLALRPGLRPILVVSWPIRLFDEICGCGLYPGSDPSPKGRMKEVRWTATELPSPPLPHRN